MYDTLQTWHLTILVALAVGLVVLYQTRTLKMMARRRDAVWQRLLSQLKERRALAPQLTTIAGLYLSWDDPLIDDVIRARKAAMMPQDVADQSVTETHLSWALARLMRTASNHSELIRHADFANITEAIGATELQVVRLRQEYNRHTALLARHLKRVTASTLASFSGVRASEPFDLDPLLARQALMSQIEAGWGQQGPLHPGETANSSPTP